MPLIWQKNATQCKLITSTVYQNHFSINHFDFDFIPSTKSVLGCVRFDKYRPWSRYLSLVQNLYCLSVSIVSSIHCDVTCFHFEKPVQLILPDLVRGMLQINVKKTMVMPHRKYIFSLCPVDFFKMSFCIFAVINNEPEIKV